MIILFHHSKTNRWNNIVSMLVNKILFLYGTKVNSIVSYIWLWNWLISARLELVLSHTEKSLIAILLYYIFPWILKENFKINTCFVSSGNQPLGAHKTVFNLIIFYFNIRGKLFTIRCENKNCSDEIFLIMKDNINWDNTSAIL